MCDLLPGLEVWAQGRPFLSGARTLPQGVGCLPFSKWWVPPSDGTPPPPPGPMVGSLAFGPSMIPPPFYFFFCLV